MCFDAHLVLYMIYWKFPTGGSDVSGGGGSDANAIGGGYVVGDYGGGNDGGSVSWWQQ